MSCWLGFMSAIQRDPERNQHGIFNQPEEIQALRNLYTSVWVCTVCTVWGWNHVCNVYGVHTLLLKNVGFVRYLFNFFLLEMNAVIQQGCVKLKEPVNLWCHIINIFLRNTVILNFQFIKECITFSVKILSSTTIFNCDDKKKRDTKSAWEWFLKDHVTRL